MDFRKVIAGLTAVAVVANSFFVGGFVANVSAQGVLNDPEFDMALSWAYTNSMTKYDTAEAFRPFSNITREESAKFTDVFAMTNLCLDPDASLDCDFSDIPADPSLDEYVILSCQLGLFRGSNGMFYPTANLTKAQLLAVLVRAIRAADGLEPLSETSDPWWANYFDYARQLDLTKETDVWALDRPVTRYETMLLIYRAAQALDTQCDTTADDILDILNDILGNNNTDDEEEVDENTTPTTSNGTLEVSLSSSTPAGDTVPGNATVTVAEYELTATGEPVVLNSLILRRYGIGNDDAVDRVSIFVDGRRMSNDKAFNSDNEAVLTLNPKVEVGTSKPVMVRVVAQVGDANVASNQEFSLGIPSADAVYTNGSVDGTFPVKANTFRIAGVNAPELSFSHDGSVSDVELGAVRAEISKFEIENTSNTNEVFLNNLTLSDGEKTIDKAATNFELVCDGDTLAETASVIDEYLPFALDEPFQVKEGKTATCRVFADIVAEAGETIDLFIDEKIDVMGESDFGYGIDANITNMAEGGQAVDILAGELTLVEVDLPSDEVKDSSDDVVLGQFKVIVNNGKDLFIEDVNFDLTPTLFGANPIEDAFENFEIFDATNNTRYDLNEGAGCASDNTVCPLSENGIDIFLPNGGEVVLQVRADTVTTFPVGLADVASVKLTLNTNPLAGDFVVKESDDDTEVNDIVPSFLSFNTVDLVESAVTITEIPLSDINIVRGATDVVALQFQIETDQVSPAFLQDITFEGNGNFDQNHVSAVRLYRGVPEGTNTLVEAQGAFDINGNQITFDSFPEIEIPVNSTQPMFVTFDVVDDPTIVGDDVEVNIDTDVNDLPSLDDDDNDDMEVTVNTQSPRTVTIEDFGTLTCNFDLSDSSVEDPTIVLGGTTSDLLGSWEITADNEPIWVRDIEFTAVGAGFSTSFDEVLLLADDGVTELYSEFVFSNVMYLNEVNGVGGGDFIVDEGTENVYVKLVASPINKTEGDTEGGPFYITMDIAEAEGVSSSEDLPAVSCTDQTEDFFARAVTISDVDLVSAVGSSPKLPSVLSQGIANNIGIIMLQADTWTNKNPANNEAIDAEIYQIQVEIENSTGGPLNNVNIRRKGESQNYKSDCWNWYDYRNIRHD
jgi:hypothetical protein